MSVEDAGRPDPRRRDADRQATAGARGQRLHRPQPGHAGRAASWTRASTIPLARTAVTPQLDQVLNVLDTPTRNSLHRSIARAAADWAARWTRARGSGYRGCAVRSELDGALGSVTQVARAARGTHPGDLDRAVSAGRATSSRSSPRDPRALADSVTGLNRVMRTFAQEREALAASIEGFDARAARRAGEPRRKIDAALPALTRLGRRAAADAARGARGAARDEPPARPGRGGVAPGRAAAPARSARAADDASAALGVVGSGAVPLHDAGHRLLQHARRSQC